MRRNRTSHPEDEALESQIQSVPFFTIWGGGSPLALIPIFAFVGISTVMPMNPFESWPVVNSISAPVLARVPWLAEHALTPAYPKAAVLMGVMAVYLLLWLALFFVGYSIVNHSRMLRNQRIERVVSWPKAILIGALAVPAIYFLLFATFALPTDADWSGSFADSDRTLFAMLCVCWIYPAGMCLGAVPASFWMLVKLDFRGTRK